MRNAKISTTLVSVLIIILSLSFSRINSAQIQDTLEQQSNGMLRVYLDCESCDFNFIRNQLPFISFLRDPEQADVHSIISRSNTASGGALFTLRFIGKGGFKKQNFDLNYTSPQSETEINRQEGISKTLTMGLMPFVAQTSSVDKIHFKFENNKEIKKLNGTIEDPWDHWIFKTDLRGGYEAEENSDQLEIEGAFDADRVTELWRFRNSFEYQFREENYEDDGEKIKSTRRSWDISSRLVKTLSKHLSSGIFGDLRANTYQNIRFAASLYPGIEYNFFPWSEFSRRVITLGYYIGYKSYDYIDQTIYEKLNEGLLFHSLRLDANIKQPWGTFEGLLDFSHFPTLDGKYRIRFNTNLAFRVSEGLSLTLRIQAQSIHDQLYLAKGDASLEEILLKQRQLQTTYSYSSSIGIRYTFGSIFNNIVNLRM